MRNFVIYPSLNYLGQQKEGACDSRDIQLSRDMNNSQERLVERTDNKEQHGRPRRKWKASINTTEHKSVCDELL